MSRFDAILIPGGGLLAGGGLPPWTVSRLELALARWSGELLIPLSAATTHRPLPLDEDGRAIFESLQAARYLRAHGVPATGIAVECTSYDTIGNAWFSRVLHAGPLGLARLLVVTSEFHMARTEACFRWVYGLNPSLPGYELTFEASPNTGLGAEALQARMQREAASAAVVETLARRITTVEGFHRWLHTEHRAYSVAGLDEAPDRVAGAVLDTY
ncbi:MAG: YdcF family protein [Bryobacteraceae bacterium]